MMTPPPYPLRCGGQGRRVIWLTGGALLLADVEGRAAGLGDGVGCVEVLQADGTHADTLLDGYQGPEELTMGVGIERGRRKPVVTIKATEHADLVDELVRDTWEPGLTDAADAVTLVSAQQEGFRRAQLPPEHDEASGGILYLHKAIK